jgi:hypothetical protein
MATLTNIAKNRQISASGGEVFYGFLFLFTISIGASGPTLTAVTKNAGTVTNFAKHSSNLTNVAKS